MIIQVNNISKLYRVGSHIHHKELKALLNDGIKKPFQRLFKRQANSNPTHKKDSYLWALKNVSFNAHQGEVIGFIGHNGAGKSTLLKILSRITVPTTGIAKIRGRVGSLLEVGTGFNQELTGRENVFFNGAILGMKHFEIKKKLDEIIAFSGVEKYIDTPIKHYSSGMIMRLAFSVASQLDTEIVMIDEVISVGDIAFQKQCLAKIWQITREGRTVLFVSHNMQALRKLCNRCVLLEHGEIQMDGDVHEVVAEYLNRYIVIPETINYSSIDHCPGNDTIRLLSVRICDSTYQTVKQIKSDQRVGVEIEYVILKGDTKPSVIIQFYNSEWVLLFEANDMASSQNPKTFSTSCKIKQICWVPDNLMNESRILINITIAHLFPIYKEHVTMREIVSFEVIAQDSSHDYLNQYGIKWPGIIRPKLEWEYVTHESL